MILLVANRYNTLCCCINVLIYTGVQRRDYVTHQYVVGVILRNLLDSDFILVNNFVLVD